MYATQHIDSSQMMCLISLMKGYDIAYYVQTITQVSHTILKHPLQVPMSRLNPAN